MEIAAEPQKSRFKLMCQISTKMAACLPGLLWSMDGSGATLTLSDFQEVLEMKPTRIHLDMKSPLNKLAKDKVLGQSRR